MARVDRCDRAPITILIDEPAAGSQAFHHASYSRLLLSGKPEQHQARADEIERTHAKRIERIAQDVMPPYLEIWDIEPLQVRKINVGRHHVAVPADLLGQPHSHRSPAGANLEAAPARLNQGATPTRARIEELFQQVEPLLFDLFTPLPCEAITGLNIRGFSGLRCIAASRHLLDGPLRLTDRLQIEPPRHGLMLFPPLLNNQRSASATVGNKATGRPRFSATVSAKCIKSPSALTST